MPASRHNDSPSAPVTTIPTELLEPFSVGRHHLPGLWKHLLPEDFHWMRLPEEREATCFDCPEVKQGEYRDDCRCCTYFPQVPNFMLGLALLHPTSQAAVHNVIARGHVLPHGMQASPSQFATAVRAYSDNEFGNLPEMVCPFVEPGTFHCNVYPFRNSICSTFFCRHDHGDTGTNFWNRLQALMGRVESTLAQWAMAEVGFDPAVLVARMDAWADRVDQSFDASGAWSEPFRRDVWGPFWGEERRFLARCASVVANRRTELYELTCIQPYLEALSFERAVRDWIPGQYRAEVPFVADAQGCSEPVPSHWYKLQLANRHLWELPFNEGSVVLAQAARIENYVTSEEQRTAFALVLGDETLRLESEHAAALELFRKPQVLGEALFARSEIDGMRDARGLIAECLRRGFLIHRDR